MSDVKTTDPEKRDAKTLSRSLASFTIAPLAKTSDPNAALSVVDEHGDDGLDAFYLSPADHTCYLVQSKWSKDGTGSIDLAGSLKFVQGVNDFVNGRLDRLGQKMKARSADINSATADSEMKFKLVIV